MDDLLPPLLESAPHRALELRRPVLGHAPHRLGRPLPFFAIELRDRLQRPQRQLSDEGRRILKVLHETPGDPDQEPFHHILVCERHHVGGAILGHGVDSRPSDLQPAAVHAPDLDVLDHREMFLFAESRDHQAGEHVQRELILFHQIVRDLAQHRHAFIAHRPTQEHAVHNVIHATGDAAYHVPRAHLEVVRVLLAPPELQASGDYIFGHVGLTVAVPVHAAFHELLSHILPNAQVLRLDRVQEVAVLDIVREQRVVAVEVPDQRFPVLPQRSVRLLAQVAAEQLDDRLHGNAEQRGVVVDHHADRPILRQPKQLQRRVPDLLAGPHLQGHGAVGGERHPSPVHHHHFRCHVSTRLSSPPTAEFPGAALAPVVHRSSCVRHPPRSPGRRRHPCSYFPSRAGPPRTPSAPAATRPARRRARLPRPSSRASPLPGPPSP